MQWEEDHLENLTVKIGSGATPHGGESVYKASGISLIRSQNVYDFIFETAGLAFIDEEQGNALANVEVQPNDILLNITGDSIGRCCIVPNSVLPARVNQHVSIIRANSRLDPKFLFYYINNPRNKAALLQVAHGATRRALTKGIIQNYKVRFPPLPIQRRIAEILGALDDKIECNRRINQTLEQMAQALYKHWFVDFGPFRDGEFVDSELGRIPKGWEAGKLGDIAENIRVAAEPRNLPNNTPYIGLEHMPKGCMTLSEWGTAADVTSNKWKFRRKQILFGKLRPYFKKVGVAPIDGVCSSDILVIEPRLSQFFGLVLCQVIQDEFISFTDAASGGTRMPRISWDQMARYQITIPPESVAAKFNAPIGAWAETIINNIAENQTLARTRDYLLPKLLSGEIEVKAAENTIGQVVK